MCTYVPNTKTSRAEVLRQSFMTFHDVHCSHFDNLSSVSRSLHMICSVVNRANGSLPIAILHPRKVQDGQPEECDLFMTNQAHKRLCF